MARNRVLLYEGLGTEITSFAVPDLAGKTIIAIWRAGQYRRAIATTPNDDEEIQVVGTDLGANKGILSTTGVVYLNSGDGLLLGEKLDFLYDDTDYGAGSVNAPPDRTAYKTYKARPFTSSVLIRNGLVSNMPAIVNYHKSQLFHLIPFHSDVSGITNLVQTFKNASGGTISTNTTNNSAYIAKKIRQVNVGASGVTIPASADYSELSGAGVSLRINYLCDGKFTPLTLSWLNPFGGYDSQSFGFMNKKSLEIERRNFSRLNYEIDSLGAVNYQSNNVFLGSRKNYATRTKIKMRLTSHLLTASEYTWLADLFISPDVYLFDADSGKFLPVIIGDNNYEYRNYMNSRLTSLEFTVEFSDDFNAQNL